MDRVPNDSPEADRPTLAAPLFAKRPPYERRVDPRCDPTRTRCQCRECGKAFYRNVKANGQKDCYQCRIKRAKKLAAARALRLKGFKKTMSGKPPLAQSTLERLRQEDIARRGMEQYNALPEALPLLAAERLIEQWQRQG